MASLELFESTLRDVVQAKKLSASKMTKLTDIALKSMQNDTQLVSVLFRTHKTLSPAAKVSSLYVFDALARAARNQVNKQGLVANINAPQGNCATFLLKVEGILDSLYQDLVSSGHAELKEKAKKILDIWVKSNTFPSNVLGRLSQCLKGETEKEPDKVTAAPAHADPRSQSVSTPPTNLPPALPAAPVDTSSIQSTLIALLSQAANTVASTNSQTNLNSATPAPTSAPVLDVNQLALFQQLTQAAKLGVPNQPIPLPVSLVPSSTASSTSSFPVANSEGGASQRPPYRNNHYGSSHRESPHDRHGGPDRTRDRDDYYDDRRDYGGGFRGGPRGRGRGRGRWDDRDRYIDRNRDREWAPSRGRPSRSRSPGRYGGRRDFMPHSPPRGPSAPRDIGESVSTPPVRPSGIVEVGKDEFGREIRAGSTDATETASTSKTFIAGSQSPTVSKTTTGSTVEHASAHSGSDNRSPINRGSSSHSPPSRQTGTVTGSHKGLESFDVSTFDPSSPVSWEALGNAWAVTHGYLPSEAELMEFMIPGSITGGAAAVAIQDTSQRAAPWPEKNDNWNNTQQHDPRFSRGAWRGGRGMSDRGRGYGGYHAHGNGRNPDYALTSMQAFEHSMDAVSHQGSGSFGERPETSGDDGTFDSRKGEVHSGEESMSGRTEGNVGTGRMRRVDDKWVFVRTEA